MNPASVLVLLGAALLLTSGGNCDICSAVTDDVAQYVDGTADDYVNYVAQYVDNPFILANARKLKNCVDGKLTEEDKALVNSALQKIYMDTLC